MEHVQILWVSRSFTESKSGVKPHSHQYYHMFYVCSGQIDMTVGTEQYRLNAGTTLLVPKETEHSYLVSGEQAAEYLEIKFALPVPTQDTQFSRMGTIMLEDSGAGYLAEQIVQEYADLGSLADEPAASYLLALLHILTRARRYEKKQSSRYIDVGEYDLLSQKIVRYLEEHYGENMSLDELAAALGRSKSYLCIAFKKDTGTTIVDCLNLIRIRRAAELITYSDYSLTQVSVACGFSSVSHFNRVFLKYVGITPGQCRRAYPANILLNYPMDGAGRADRFMYSVLAQKRITPTMMQKLDELEQEQGADQ